MPPVLSADEKPSERAKSRVPAQHHASKRPNKLPSRTIVNFVLDSVLLVVFVALMGVSAIVRFVFPPATAAAGWRLWGGSLDDWLVWQFDIVAALTGLIVLHVMLHWTWVCGVIGSKLNRRRDEPARLDDGQRTLLGVGLLIVILNIVGGLVAAATLTIHTPG